MSITTQSTLYCDDLNVQDANGKTPLDKNYMRILFKPGISVQTRELNQLQSLLQTQIDRVGSSLFKSGKPVIGGAHQFDKSTSMYSIDVATNEYQSDSALAKIVSVSSEDLHISKVVSVKRLQDNIQGGFSYAYRFYVKSVSSGLSPQNLNISKYEEGQTLSFYSDDDIVTDQIVFSAGVFQTGNAVGAKIAEGIFFVRGSFVHIPSQYITKDLDPGTTFTGNLVLKIEEGVVNSSEDTTLLDNARGYPNYAEPGADRYTIDLSISFIGSAETVSYTYANLATIKNDIITVDLSYDSASPLDDKLAQRTYDESGNYEVNPFQIHLREAYLDLQTKNGGLFSTDIELRENGYPFGEAGENSTAIDAAKADLVAQIDPSVAYVNGYRVELVNKTNLIINKARSTASLPGVAISANIGNYVDGQFESGSAIPLIESSARTYDLLNSAENPAEAKIGTCRIKTVEARPDDIYRLFLFDVQLNDTKKISDAVKITGGSSPFVIDFSITTLPQDVSNTAAIFELPQSPVREITNLTYTQKRNYITTVTVGGQVTITADGPFDKNPINILVCKGNQIITEFGVDTNIDAKTLTLLDKVGEDSTDNFTVGSEISIIAAVTLSGRPGVKRLKSATLTKDQLEALEIEIPDQPPTGEYILSTFHLHRITSSTDLFEIITDGQTPGEYVNAKIKKVGTGVLPDQISYEYFDFDNDTSDFFTYESYFDSRSGTDARLAYQDFPRFGDIPLFDVIDFRYYNINEPTKQVRPIDPYSAIQFDMSYYLPRVDTIAVNSLGRFYVKEGISASDPQPPAIPSDAMPLYNLRLGAYTFGPDDVTIEKIDNQRYTMSNIRSLDRRITNIEYYTSLSLLEKQAKDQSVYDDELDIERFKNGFVVDNFVGHNVGDPADPGYICAVDTNNNSLRPAFTTRSLKLVPSDLTQIAASSQYNKSGVHENSLTLPYKEESYINQSSATSSISVNPHQFGTVVGSIKLSPATDHWVDTRQRPDLVVKNNSVYDAIKHFAKDFEAELQEDGVNIDILGTEWNSWEKYWEGEKTSKLVKTEIDRPSGIARFFGARTTTKKTYNVSQEVGYAREGLRTAIGIGSIQEKNLGNRVVNTAIRPYIRSRFVYIKATGLKSNTVYYPYFDGTDVSKYVYKITAEQYSQGKQSNIASVNGGPVPTIVPGINYGTTANQTLRTDDTGSMFGLFIIPNGADGLRFPTGSRTLRLTDSARNNSVETRSYADATYTASGLLQTRRKTILSTAVPEIVKTEVLDTQHIVEKTTNVTRKKCRWGDPVAQSILVANPEGIFATSIDLYFATKATDQTQEGQTAPVEVYIVPCENGIPTQDIVPFTNISMRADDVNISLTGDAATTFTFEQPVYLQPGQEYAIVVTSADSDYSVFISRVGGKDLISGNPLVKNEYMGVFFTSQNSSTWTPEQDVDLKFVLNRANFITETRQVSFLTDVSSQVSDITFAYPDEQDIPSYQAAPTVTITGDCISPASAVAVLDQSGRLTKIQLVPAPTASGILAVGGQGYTGVPTVALSGPVPTIGGVSYAHPSATALMHNFPTSSFYLKQDSVIVSGIDEENPDRVIQTDLDNSISVLGKTYDIEDGTTYNSYLEKRSWDDNGITINNPAVLTTTLKTTNNYISPVVDIERLSLKVVRNRIKSDLNTTSKYITRNIPLATAADRLDIYFDINRPSAANNVVVKAKFVYGQSDESEWIEISPFYPQTIPVNANGYTEMHYKVNPDKDFVEFKVMLMFVGSDIVDVPTIKKLRAIATI